MFPGAQCALSPHLQDEGVCPPDVCVLSLLEDGCSVQIVSQHCFCLLLINHCSGGGGCVSVNEIKR